MELRIFSLVFIHGHFVIIVFQMLEFEFWLFGSVVLTIIYLLDLTFVSILILIILQIYYKYIYRWKIILWSNETWIHILPLPLLCIPSINKKLSILYVSYSIWKLFVPYYPISRFIYMQLLLSFWFRHSGELFTYSL